MAKPTAVLLLLSVNPLLPGLSKGAARIGPPTEFAQHAGVLYPGVDPVLAESLSAAAPLLLKADPSMLGYDAFAAMAAAGGDSLAPLFAANHTLEDSWRKLARGSWQRKRGIENLREDVLFAAQLGAEDAVVQARDLVLRIRDVLLWDYGTGQHHGPYLSKLNLEAAEMNTFYKPALSVDPVLERELTRAHVGLVEYIRGIRKFQLESFIEGEKAKLASGGKSGTEGPPGPVGASPLPPMSLREAQRLLRQAREYRVRLNRLFGWQYGAAMEVIDTLGFIRLVNGHEHAKHLIFLHPWLNGFRFNFPMGHSGEVSPGFMRDVRRGVDMLIDLLLEPAGELPDDPKPAASDPPRRVPPVSSSLNDSGDAETDPPPGG